MFTGEHLCRGAISIKLQSKFIEIALWHGCSPVNLLHIFRTPFPKNTSGWLFLYQHVLFQIVQSRKLSLQNDFCQTHRFKILKQRNTFFSLKKKERRKKNDFKLPKGHTEFDVALTSISMMLLRYMHIEQTKAEAVICRCSSK